MVAQAGRAVDQVGVRRGPLQLAQEQGEAVGVVGRLPPVDDPVEGGGVLDPAGDAAVLPGAVRVQLRRVVVEPVGRRREEGAGPHVEVGGVEVAAVRHPVLGIGGRELQQLDGADTLGDEDVPVVDLAVLVEVAATVGPRMRRVGVRLSGPVDRIEGRGRRVDAELVGQVRQRLGQHAAVRQLPQVGLQGVEHAPQPPHAGDVVLGDVAVIREVADGVLGTSGAVVEVGVEHLARPDRLRVEHDALLGAVAARLLEEAGVAVVEVGVGRRVQVPVQATTVQVVDVVHLRPAVHDPQLHGVGHVGPGHRYSRLTEGVRVVRQRLLLALRHGQPVHEWLRPVVDGPRPRPVRAGERVDEGQLVAVAVGDDVPLVPDLVEDRGVVTEGLRGRAAVLGRIVAAQLRVGGVEARDDHGLLACHLLAGRDLGVRRDLVGRARRVQGDRARRLDDEHAEQSLVHGVAERGPRVHVVAALELWVLRDPEAVRVGAADAAVGGGVHPDCIA